MAATDLIFITGASGFVGRNIARWFVARGAQRVASGYHQTALPADLGAATQPVGLDICDASLVAAIVDELRPRVVIHLAGNKNVRECEANPDMAEAVNAQGTLHVATACQAAQAAMLYLSTDLVFPCTSGGYTEADTPDSSLAYGRSKHHGEVLAAGALANLAICRSGGVYGQGSPLLRWLMAELKAGRQVEAFTDVYNTPTYAANLAEMLARVAARGLTGVFHLVGRQRVNRLEFFQNFAEVFQLPADLLVPSAVGLRHKDLLLTADASLANPATLARLGGPFLSVREGLAELRAVTPDC